MSIKPRLARFNQKTCVLCAACLPASLITHVPIYELHERWHWSLHLWRNFSMSLNSHRHYLFNHSSKLWINKQKIKYFDIRCNYEKNVLNGRSVWLNELGSYLTTHTSLSPIRHGFVPRFVNYKTGCTRLADASDKSYQLLAHGRWFSPGTPSSSTIKTVRHDTAEILLKVSLKHQKSYQSIKIVN